MPATSPHVPATAEPTTHDLGETLGPYRLVEVLGSGGMGRVFLAEHELLGRFVAVKVLRSEYARDPSIVKRFFAEARTVNQVAHENIVEITDFVDEEDGTSFLVMEYLRGRTLSAELTRGPLGLKRALHIGRQIASALAAVHGIGIVHRDLKPDNVFLVDDRRRDDFIKLLDFGAAKLNSTVVPGNVETQAVTLIGTPQYMSPEQATGAPVDARSDVYALGVVLYEMITGGNPFRALDAWSTIRNQVALSPAAPDTVVAMIPPSPQLSDLIMRCLEKEPDGRPDSMEEIEQALARIDADLRTPSGVFAKQSPAAAAPPAPPPLADNPSTLMLRQAGVGRSSSSKKWAGVAAAALVAVAVAGFTLGGDAEAPSTTRAAAAQAAAEATSAEPAPLEAQVTLRTEPEGVEVVDAEGKVLGVTPFTATLEGSGPSTLTYRKAGFIERTEVVPHASGVAARTILEESPKPRRRVKRAARPTPKPAPRSTPRPVVAPPAPKPARGSAPRVSRPSLQSKNAVIDPLLE